MYAREGSGGVKSRPPGTPVADMYKPSRRVPVGVS
jgi:hypothetical protein